MTFALTAIPCFAYSSYSSSDDFSGFTTLLFIVFGLLNLILFFKIWGMTNNVKELKNDYKKINRCFESSYSNMYSPTDLKKMLMTGNKEEYKASVIINFCNHMEQIGTVIYANEAGRKGKSIRPDVEDLQKQFDVIGESLPEYIQKLETLADYYNLFNPEKTKTPKPASKE